MLKYSTKLTKLDLNFTKTTLPQKIEVLLPTLSAPAVQQHKNTYKNHLLGIEATISSCILLVRQKSLCSIDGTF